MKLAILHLSDIHFQHTKKFALSRTSEIKNAVTAANIEWDDMLIVLSGDVAFSGTKSEYAIAQAFVEDLKKKLEEAKPSAVFNTVTVPGNHDCDYTSSENATRKMILGYLQSNHSEIYPDTAPLRHLLSVQDNYDEFRKAISTDPGDGKDVTRVAQTVEVPFRAGQVRVQLFNTALGCERRTSKTETDQGKLFLPLHIVNKGSFSTGDIYTITVMHHPLNWLESTNGVAARHFISSTSDLILTGHQHEEDAESKESIKKEKNLWVRATALQDETGSSSGFNLIVVDTESLDETVIQFSWTGGFYEAGQRKSWAKSQSQRSNRRQIPLNDDARLRLTDPGTGFTHPSKKQLNLDDIFVQPKLSSLLGANLRDDGEDTTEEDNQTPNLTKEKLTIVLGEARSGKTTLAKRVFTETYNSDQNITPLVLAGGDINSSHLHVEKLWRLIERNFKQFYSAKALEMYTQLQPSSRMLIIDNWQSCQLNDLGKRDLLDMIERRFSSTLLFADETVKLEHVTTYTEHFADQASFAAYRIKPFGHFLRAKLIRKWLLFAREKTVSQQSLHEEIFRAEAVINTVLGKSLMPSYPFFVLSLLQVDQNIKTTNHANGSYGYLYESLITMSLAEVSKQSTEIDIYYTILGRLAWELYSTQTDTVTASELGRVIREYADEYKSIVDPTQITNKLLLAKLLASSEGHYFFRYKYIYCFFMARYLSDKLKTPDAVAQAREIILRLADSITKEESANIVIFLIYFTRDPELIEKLLSNAEALFASAPLFDADSSLLFLAPAVERYVKTDRLTVNSSPETNRDREREQLDTIAAKEDHDNENDVNDEAGPNSEFAKAIKLLDILGQIVRNFPGSMPGKVKVRITSEVYRLGLRVASVAVSSIEADTTKFRKFVKKGIVGNDSFSGGRKLSEEELDKKADELMVLFIGMIAFGIFKTITTAVGLSQLRPTYDEVKAALNNTPAVNLIDLSIALDHGTEFPKSQVLKLNESFRDKWFGRMLLRRLVAYHFMMFHVERATAKSVGEKLGIDMQGPEIISKLAAGKR